MGWQTKFYDPIPMPNRKPLVTLRDAALYITKLPKAEHDADEWQAAMQALILVAEQVALSPAREKRPCGGVIIGRTPRAMPQQGRHVRFMAGVIFAR
jgi:hypothetical protein